MTSDRRRTGASPSRILLSDDALDILLTIERLAEIGFAERRTLESDGSMEQYRSKLEASEPIPLNQVRPKDGRAL